MALFAMIPPANSQAEQTAQQLYQSAHSEFTKRNYAAAAQKFRELLKLRPDSPQVWSDLGVAYSLEGRSQAAVETFEKALRLDPSLPAANLMLGIDLVRLGKPAGAIPLFERVLRQQPSNRSALSGLASAFFATRQFDKAADVYRRETLLPGKDGNGWYGLGLCFEHMAEDAAQSLRRFAKESPYYHELVGQFLTNEDTNVRQQSAGIEAVSELRLALSASTNNPEGFHAALGFAQLGLGQISQASQEFEKELDAYPGSLDGKLGLADVAVARGDFDNAVQSLCKIYLADPGFYASHLNPLAALLPANTQSLVLNYLKGTHVSASCRVPTENLKRALDASPSEVEISNAFEPLPQVAKDSHSIGRRLSMKARSELASGHYTLCMQTTAGLSGSSEGGALILSKCAFLSGHFLIAYEAAKNFLAHSPENARGVYWKAEAAKRLSQSAFQTAISLSPNSWEGHVLLGDIYIQHKKWDRAISEYEAAARLKPGSPAPYLGLGTVYWQNGLNDRASPVLRKALQLDPENAQANFEMGDVLVREHHYNEAVPYLKRTVQIKPNFLPAHADLGKIYLASGTVHKAMVEILKALPMDRSGDLHYQLYLVYKKQGMTRQAQQALADSQRLRADALKTHQESLEKAFHLAKKAANDGKP